MAEALIPKVATRQSAAFSFLFAPRAVVVLDVFRSLADFEDHYDVAALDRIEESLCSILDRLSAKGLVSDALLLAFGLRRERSEPLDFMPVGARRGTLDEYRLHAMIAGCYWHDFALAGEASRALSLTHAKPLVSLAFDIARRLELAGIRLDVPSAHLLHAGSRGAGDSASSDVRRVAVVRDYH